MGNICVIYQRRGQKSNNGLSRCPASALGMRLRHWIWRIRRKGEDPFLLYIVIIFILTNSMTILFATVF